jgi:hypothetical protein
MLAPELALRTGWETARTWLPWESSLLEEGARVGSAAHLAPSGLLLRSWAGTGWNLNLLTSVLAATSAAAVGLAATRIASPGLALAVALGFGWSATLWFSAVAAGGNLRPVLDLALLSLAVVAARAPGAHGRLLGVALALVASLDDIALLWCLPAVTWVAARQRRAVAATLALAVLLIAVQWLLDVVPFSSPTTAGGQVAEGFAAHLSLWLGGAPGADVMSVTWERLRAIGIDAARSLGVLGLGLAAVGLASPVSALPVRTLGAGLLLGATFGPIPGEFERESRTLFLLLPAWLAIAAGMARLARSGWTQSAALAGWLAIVVPAIQALGLVNAQARVIPGSGDALRAVLSQTSRGTLIVERTPLMRVLRWGALRCDAECPRVRAVSFDVRPTPQGAPVRLSAGAWQQLALAGADATTARIVGRPLSTAVAGMPGSALVASAGTPGAYTTEAWAALAGSTGRPDAQPAGLVTSRSLPELRVVRVGASVTLDVSPSDPGGVPAAWLPPGGIGAHATTWSATAILNSLEVAHTTEGLALAYWDPRTGEWGSDVFRRQDGLAGAWQVPGLEWYDLMTPQRCSRVAHTWSDVRSMAISGRVGLIVPPEQSLTLWVGSRRPLAARVATIGERSAPQWTAAQFGDDASGREALAAELERDGLPPASTGLLSRVVLTNPDAAPSLVALALGGPPQWLQVQGPEGARVCQGPGGARVSSAASLSRQTSVSLLDSEAFGDGWATVERQGGRRTRALVGASGELFLHAEQEGEILLELGTMELSASGPTHLFLEIDGARVGPSTGDQRRHGWTIPRTMWRRGFHVLRIHRAAGSAERVVVTSVLLTRQ